MPPTLIADLNHPKIQWLESFASEMLELPARLRQDWDRLSSTVARSGRSAELHAAREEYLKVYEGYLHTLDGFRGLAEVVHSPVAEQFRQAAEQVRQLKAEIFEGWNTQEDLEQKLVDKFTLPNEVLIALAEKYPPPQSRYDESTNPFVPDDE